VLFADPSVGRFYAHDSPYTYFTSDELHLGEISLECSRAGASAAALWTTLQALPLERDRGLGAQLARTRAAGVALAERVAADDRVALVVEPELDIVCVLARDAADPSVAAERAFATLAAQGWHVATVRLDAAWARRRNPWLPAGADTVTALRCCLLKPEHLDVVDELAAALIAALAGD
jgi:glutamate/tyrosine decarboxylase-like PLP-dependent enzyme